MSSENVYLYDWVDEWLNTYEKPKIKESTYITYFYAIKQIKHTLSNNPITSYREIDGQRCLNKLCELGYSKSTIDKAKIILKCSFKKAAVNGMIQNNPFDYLYTPSSASKKVIKALTVSEQKAVEDACYNDLHGVFMLFLLNTGLRSQEFCNLKWTDYDKKIKGIFVRKSKTINGVRFIPLLPVCQQIIETRPKINEYIFNSTNGNPATQSVLKKTYKRIQKTTGITHFTTHVCRHTFATRLIENGAENTAVSRILGHSSVNFTSDRYVDTQVDFLHSQIVLLK